MPTYKDTNWENIMECLDLARRYSESDQYFKMKGDGEIHYVELKYTTQEEAANSPDKPGFEITINECYMGEGFEFSDAYEFIHNCIVDVEENAA